jgi:acetyl-CoA synthetase
VVGKPDDINGEGISNFVTLISGTAPSEELKKELRDHVAKEVGALARPE